MVPKAKRLGITHCRYCLSQLCVPYCNWGALPHLGDAQQFKDHCKCNTAQREPKIKDVPAVHILAHMLVGITIPAHQSATFLYCARLCMQVFGYFC